MSAADDARQLAENATDVAKALTIGDVVSAVEQIEQDELRTIQVICSIGDAAVHDLEQVLGEAADVEQCPYSDLALCLEEPEARQRRADLEAGVRFIIDNPAAPLSAQHEAWKERNRARLAPDDPRLVPYDKLPFGIQLKARLWRHIVHAIIG